MKFLIPTVLAGLAESLKMAKSQLREDGEYPASEVVGEGEEVTVTISMKREKVRGWEGEEKGLVVRGEMAAPWLEEDNRKFTMELSPEVLEEFKAEADTKSESST